MNFAELSIKRPIFITCVVIVMLVVGFLSLKKMPVNLYPDVTFPVVVITTAYPGAGPSEIETLVTKPFEDAIVGISGMDTLKSINKEGVSIIVARFKMETDIKYAEQQIRNNIAMVRSKVPAEIEEPIIRNVDIADQPILLVTVSSSLPPVKLYDVVDQYIKPKLEQVNQVGKIDIFGGRKREIKVELDRYKLRSYEITATQVAQQIQAAGGKNLPVGKVDKDGKELNYRTLGEFRDLKDIEKAVVSFMGNDVPITVKDLGTVVDSLEEEKNRTFVNGKQSLMLQIYKQSGSNTVQVANDLKKRIAELNKSFSKQFGDAEYKVVFDSSVYIKNNMDDVNSSIMLGIFLTIVVVLFFLGNIRSTIITGLALPNSLLGSFILMNWFGFSINMLSMMALSLAVGLLIDDAIVVRENIFRHIEHGEDPFTAAKVGTAEVVLAVVATSLTVISIFGPVGFLKGMVGQFFREFGLTVCFAMAISLFDALTMAPMLSAYFGGISKRRSSIAVKLQAFFEKFHKGMEILYDRILKYSLQNPGKILLGAFLIFVLSLFVSKFIPKTFQSEPDFGEFAISLETPPGTSLDGTYQVAGKIDELLRKHKDVVQTVMIIGNADGTPNIASYFVKLTPFGKRTFTTGDFKEQIRKELAPFSFARPKVTVLDIMGVGMRAFNLNIIGEKREVLEPYAAKIFEKIKNDPNLRDVDTTYRPGFPEFQIRFDDVRAKELGVSSSMLGLELRTQVEGFVPAVFREEQKEYDIRVRMKESQRSLEDHYNEVLIPNINRSIIRLSDVAKGVRAEGSATIYRFNRGRYVAVNADLAPKGKGMAGLMESLDKTFSGGDLKLPEGVTYAYEGQAENFRELVESMLLAIFLGVMFVFLILSSLYESFITPFTIMLVLPLAICGAFYALFITGRNLDIFSMIGCILLLGVSTKNSILLVDYTEQLMREGVEMKEALIKAGRTRLRPILMTSFALIAGMIPLAIGLSEVSTMRRGMGIAVIGGLISSTFLTLVVIPVAFTYIERLKVMLSKLRIINAAK